MPSEQFKAILQTIRERPTPVTVSDWRERLAIVAETLPVAEDIACEPVRAGGVEAEWIVAPGASRERVILYVHGGGYVSGTIASHRDWVSRLSRESGAAGLSLNYRLAPENPFPAAIEDATAAYRWLLEQGIQPGAIVIAGDSAGGGLTAATLLALRDAGDPMPGGAVMVSPWTDMEGTGESMKTRAAEDPIIPVSALKDFAGHYLNGENPRNPLASPIHADLKGLPPILILVGTAEVLLDDSTRFADRAKAAGVDITLDIWEEMIHIWPIYAPFFPEGHEANQKIGAFIRARQG